MRRYEVELPKAVSAEQHVVEFDSEGRLVPRRIRVEVRAPGNDKPLAVFHINETDRLVISTHSPEGMPLWPVNAEIVECEI